MVPPHKKRMLQSHPFKKRMMWSHLFKKGMAEISTLQYSELTLQLPECRLLRAHSEGGGAPVAPR